MCKLNNFAKEAMRLHRDEAQVRLILTDTDLQGRDVLTIICQNDLVELLAHPYIEKLAD